MLTLLSECHFWTLKDEVRIKSNDYGAFRYLRNREVQHQQQDIGALAKRDYVERRNGLSVLRNARKGRRTGTGVMQKRLKDNVKKLEELLGLHKVIYSEWRDGSQLLLLFDNGMIVNVFVDIYTGESICIVFEKYFIAKLAAETITDAFFTRTHIVLAYNTNTITVVHLQKPMSGLEKISKMDPQIFHVIIPGPPERKLPRNLCVNSSFDLFAIWTKSSQNEVFPWRPTIREADRANVHVFKLQGMQLESIAYCWTENDPLCVAFLRSSESQILTVEEKISRKGEMSAEIFSYEIGTGKMQRTALSSIPMGAQICSFAFSPDQEKLFLGTIDRKACIHDIVLRTTKFAPQMDIIPRHCSWHSDSSIIMTSNDRGLFQCFDLALSPIGIQMLSEDVTPICLLDLSHYFTMQPTLLNISFSKKPDLATFAQKYAQMDCFLLAIFENGPLACLRFFAGSGMRGDIHNSGLTTDVVVDKFLALNQLEKAVNLLLSLNWETYGAMCLISLHKIANYVFYRGEPKRFRIELLNKALNGFVPTLTEETKDDFSDQVFDLKRRFFFYLLRKNLFAEAFEVALDVEDYDLFMDLFNVTKSDEHFLELSAAAFSQAAAILHEEEAGNGNVTCLSNGRPESACSQSTSSEVIHYQRDREPKTSIALKNYVPPLPSVKAPRAFNAEMSKINIPKPELRSISNESMANKTRMLNPVSSKSSLEQPASSEGQNLLLISESAISAEVSSFTQHKAEHVQVQNYQQFTAQSTKVSENFILSSNNNWQNPPDQTIGIPTVSNDKSFPFVAQHNILTCLNNGLYDPPSNAPTKTTQAANNLQYVTSAKVIAELANRRSYQKNFAVPSYTTKYHPKVYQHPLVSGIIPGPMNVVNDDNLRRPAKKPSASILSNSSLPNGASTESPSDHIIPHKEAFANGSKSGSGGNVEKNKVKFSDTVQVAVVPDIHRKDKTLTQKRNGYSRPSRSYTNPKRELADSLPICHPHDEYLKDFNPLSSVESSAKASGKSSGEKQVKSHNKAATSTPTATSAIKVVHFGVV